MVIISKSDSLANCEDPNIAMSVYIIYLLRFSLDISIEMALEQSRRHAPSIGSPAPINGIFCVRV